jgi:PAS domain S-box-containing protein
MDKAVAQPTTGIRRGRRAGSAAAEPVFDAIVRQASALCGAPIAVLSLRQGKQHRILALAGRTDTDALPLWLDVCSRNLATDDWVEVEDTLADPRCNGLRALPAAPLVRAFAAKPLRLDSGEAVGMLWLLSDQPHRLAPAQARVLAGLASIAGHALALRGDALANHATASASTATAPAPTTPETETETETGTDTDTEIRYRAIVEDQVDMISLARADGRLVYVNPAYARHFGHRPPEMIGISLFDFIAAPDRDPVRRLLTQVLDSGVSVHSENRMQAADGTTLWVAWTNGLQVDARQQRLLHSVGRDVTQRKLAELALRASQAFLERTGRVAGVGGWELAIASGALTWSNETRRIHDVSADYPPTLTEAIAFYAPQARAAIAAAVQRSLDSGDPWDLELPFVTATGRAIWVRTVGEAEFEQGKAVRLVGAIQDVTERHQLELQLADNARFLRQLTDGLPLRIAYLDDQRRYRFVNQELLRHLGRARDEVIGRTRIDLRPDDDDAILGQRAQAALQGQDQRFEFEEVVDGQPRRFENRLVPDRDPTGRVRGFFVTGIDITERSAAERAMRELTTIFDNTTDLVVQTDRRGQINYMNPSARRAVGLAADAPLAGRNFTEFNTDATNRLFAQTIVPAVKQGAVWVGETSLNLAGRLAVPASHMVIGHLDGQGRVDRYSSVIRDISAEVQAKQQVLRQTATLRSVAEAIPATVVVIDTDGSCRFVNRAYERWCGLPRDRIIGHQASEVLGGSRIRAPQGLDRPCRCR